MHRYNPNSYPGDPSVAASAAPHPGAGTGMLPLDALLEENRRLKNDNEQLSQRVFLLEKLSHFPEQQRAGVIAYPDRRPFPMSVRDELLEDAGDVFATNQATARASFHVDVEHPTFLRWISFNAYWTASGLVPPRTLNADIRFRVPDDVLTVNPYTSNVLSFRWRIRGSADDRQWQAVGHNGGGAWRNSADLDAMGRYTLPVEYELRRNDTLIIEAEPLAANAAGEVCKLFANLHFYKMYETQPKLR